MLKFVIFIVAAYVIYKLFIGDQRKKKQEQVKEQEKMAADGLMIKDPICGTYVSTETSIRVRSGKDVYCFCSYDCRDKYLARLEEKKNDTQEVK